jgi:23S rRNA U2552 (ribose-2'-O)-methylase RlmE/FtsJ
MAPNATGMGDVDHPRITSLVRKVMSFAVKYGKVGSHFLTKIWDGAETPFVEEELSSIYERVTRLKPPSSRGDSKELFIFARSKKINK